MGASQKRKSMLSLWKSRPSSSSLSIVRNFRTSCYESGKLQRDRKQFSPADPRRGDASVKRWKQPVETVEEKNQLAAPKEEKRRDQIDSKLVYAFSSDKILVAGTNSENPICDEIKILKSSIDEKNRVQCLTGVIAVARVLPFNMSYLFYLPISINGFKCLGLLDSGCSTSIIDHDFLISVLGSRVHVENWNSSSVIELACGQEAAIKGVVDVEFEVHSEKFRQQFVVSSDKGNPLILGLPVLCNLNIDIDFEKKTYKFRNSPEKVYQLRDVTNSNNFAVMSTQLSREVLWEELSNPILVDKIKVGVENKLVGESNSEFSIDEKDVELKNCTNKSQFLSSIDEESSRIDEVEVAEDDEKSLEDLIIVECTTMAPVVEDIGEVFVDDQWREIFGLVQNLEAVPGIGRGTDEAISNSSGPNDEKQAFQREIVNCQESIEAMSVSQIEKVANRELESSQIESLELERLFALAVQLVDPIVESPDDEGIIKEIDLEICNRNEVEGIREYTRKVDIGEVPDLKEEIVRPKVLSLEERIRKSRFDVVMPDHIKTQNDVVEHFRGTVFSEELGCCNMFEATVDVEDDIPVKDKMRVFPPWKQEVFVKVATELKRRGICRRSTSDHRAFPVALVKPNGKIRTCVDWRRLNKKTREYALGKPLIKDIIWKLGGGNANFLTVMDCSEGYYQIKLKDNASMRRTAFWMPPSEQ